jgi:hypothetical protein
MIGVLAEILSPHFGFLSMDTPFQLSSFFLSAVPSALGSESPESSMLSLTFRKKFLRNKLGYCII